LIVPKVYALNESLYVDGFVNRNPGDDWTYVGASPYLSDLDTNSIYTKTDAAESGDYSFTDSGVGVGAVNDVLLYLEVKADDVDDDHIEVYVYDGAGWHTVTMTLDADQNTYHWKSLDLDDSGWIDTWAKIDACQLYVAYDKVGGADEYYVRRAYLYIDYSEAGVNYERETTLSLDWDGSDERVSWSTSQETDLSLDWDGSPLREWITSRAQTLSLSTTWTALRTWSLLRVVSQSFSMSFAVIRTWTLSRTITQGLTFAWEAIGELVASQSYLRVVTLSLTSTLNAVKGAWSLTRVITQPIVMSFNALREWTLLRTVSQGITFTWDAYGSRFVEYLFDLRVTDSLLPLGNAMVQILQGSSTIWTGQTLTNGSISTQTLPEGNYSLYIELDGYIQYENLLNLNTNINWDVALTTLTFNLQFFAFMIAALAFMYYGWTQHDTENSLIGLVLSLVFWVATIGQWVFDTSTDNNVVLWWVFLAPLLLCVMKIGEAALTYMERGEKNLGKY
jgi:hypothetical protein